MEDLKSAIKILELRPKQRTEEQILRLINLTSQVKFFKQITEDEKSIEVHKQCCNYITLQRFSPDQIVFNYGDVGGHFYIILQGQVSIQIPLPKSIEQEYIDPYGNKATKTIQTTELTEVAEIGAGIGFGELALINNQPRAATVQCKSHCIFGVLTADKYKRILGKIEQRRLNDRIRFLQNLTYFSNWSKAALTKLCQYFTIITFHRNQWLYRQGDKAEHIFIIRYGEFKFTQKVDIEADLKDPTAFVSGNEKTMIMLKRKQSQAEKVKQLQITHKGQNQFVGLEEFYENIQYRQFSCQCMQDFSIVYQIKNTDFQQRITYSETKQLFQKKFKKYWERLQQRLQKLKNLEIYKYQATHTVSRSVSKEQQQEKPQQLNLSFQSDNKVKTRLQYISSNQMGRFIKRRPNSQYGFRPPSSIIPRVKSRIGISPLGEEYRKKKRPDSNMSFTSSRRYEPRRRPPPNFHASPTKRSTNFSSRSENSRSESPKRLIPSRRSVKRKSNIC